MMSCKEVTRLMSEGFERGLTLRERLTLRMHTMMCTGCTNYGKHLAFLRRATQRLRDGEAGGES